MSAFQGKLFAECLGDRKWKLTKTLIYHSDIAHQAIIVPAGFETDLLSTYDVPFADTEFDGCNNRAAVIHDYLYSCHMFDRRMCDEILFEACLVEGTSKIKAWIIWLGVRIGGGSHY